MSLRTQLLTIGIGLAMLFGGASQAQAAKGVKKKNGAEHHHHGKVVSVNHKSGHITIQEHHNGKKKANANANAGKGVTRTHKFTVSSSTKFYTGHKKGQRKATSFAAVHTGEYVSIASHDHHADVVVIHSKPKKAAKKNNMRKKM